MSAAWKIMVSALHKQGGGPLPRVKFDPLESEAAANHGIKFARANGLITRQRLNKLWQWTITQKGVDWCEGRISIGAPPPPEKAFDLDAHRARVERLVADSMEAAQACAKLNERQTDVLVMAAKGFTYVEIGERIGVTTGRAQEIGRKVISAIGCTRVIEAAVIAAKAGLV